MSFDPKLGELYGRQENGRTTAVTRLSNANFANLLISRYRRNFKASVLKAQETLVNDLRSSHVDVAPNDSVHLLKVCGVQCRDEHSCLHGNARVKSGDAAAAVFPSCAEHLSDAEQQHRMIVACDGSCEARLHETAMECFPRGDNELMVRVHLFYPDGIRCCSKEDLRGRLVAQNVFVPFTAGASQQHPLFHRRKDYRDKKEALESESMFPYSSNKDELVGFNTEQSCTAVTVECVFVRDAARQEAPYYSEDTEQTRVYFSRLRVTALVTDDELAAHLPLRPVNTLAMPGRSTDSASERLNVPVRLFLLAHDQGWAATLSAGSPHPLGSPQLPVLFRTASTEVEVADRRDASSLALLRQDLQPDAESQITRFCFRRVVSEALRRRVVAAGRRCGTDAAPYVPVVCYMPHGDRMPAFTNAQIAVLKRLYPSLDIARPATRVDWARLSSTLYQHGVALLDILQAVGAPLVDAQGVAITTDAYVPYTPDLADAYFLVVANRPLRDYTCVVNQRWLLEDVLQRRCDSATTRDGFHAWVRYWNTMMQLKHELESRFSNDIICVHLGQRLPPEAYNEKAVCLVTGRVTDTVGGVVFPELDVLRFVDAAHVGHLPPGMPVVYKCWRDKKLRFEYLAAPLDWVKAQRQA